MSILNARERKQKEAAARYDAPDIAHNTKSAQKLVAGFKKKASGRMKTFHLESTRMEKKFPELIEKAESLGVQINKLTINGYDQESLLNFRKRTKHLSFNVEATRDRFALSGMLNITPASMKLELNCSELKQVRTGSGWALPLLKITYYRTLNVRDNYLAALVGGGTPSKVDVDMEIPF